MLILSAPAMRSRTGPWHPLPHTASSLEMKRGLQFVTEAGGVRLGLEFPNPAPCSPTPKCLHKPIGSKLTHLRVGDDQGLWTPRS